MTRCASQLGGPVRSFLPSLHILGKRFIHLHSVLNPLRKVPEVFHVPLFLLKLISTLVAFGIHPVKFFAADSSRWDQVDFGWFHRIRLHPTSITKAPLRNTLPHRYMLCVLSPD
jgi:hypothetical protein